MDVYHDMIHEVLTLGSRKENRTGVDTISTFNYNYELAWVPWMYQPETALGGAHGRYVLPTEPGSGVPIPLLTTKEISWKNIVVEMLWFLSGQTDIEILKRHKCKFWDAWVDENGKVPSAYGNFWRQFPVHQQVAVDSDTHLLRVADAYLQVAHYEQMGYNDQLKWVIDELRRNPMSRRLVVSAWAPENAQKSKLPPCHLLFAFNVQNIGWTDEQRFEWAEEFIGADVADANPDIAAVKKYIFDTYSATEEGKQKLLEAMQVGVEAGTMPPAQEQRLCLHLTQRSCDLALGVPYNMASYGLLLAIVSHLTGIKPGIFAHSLLDLHIYTSKPDGSMAEYDHVPGLHEQADREPRSVPRVIIDPSIKELSDIEALMAPEVTTEEILEKFKLVGYDPHPAIRFRVAV